MAVTTGTRNPGRAPVPECEETTSGGQWEGRAVASWDSCPSVTLRRGEGYLAWRRGLDKRQGLVGPGTCPGSCRESFLSALRPPHTC